VTLSSWNMAMMCLPTCFLRNEKLYTSSIRVRKTVARHIAWYKHNIHCQNDPITDSTAFTYLQLWSELLAPLVNMIKTGCKNRSALFILLIFH